MSGHRLLIVGGGALLLLSLGSVILAQATAAGALAIGGLLMLALAKGWVISEAFMGLRRAPWPWRLALLGWPLAMGLAIGVLAIPMQ